jgi:hypothetical protein
VILHLSEIHALACRFIPNAATDPRLYTDGHQSWWPAHEIGHFLIATPDECHQPKFGIDIHADFMTPSYRYVVIREIAATSISQRLLRRSGHKTLAEDEIQYTDETTLECSFDRWCKQAVAKLLHTNKVKRLPSSYQSLEALLAHKALKVARR